ncbi:MAG: hypothetical protein LBH00_08845 [Planctomycetaceae bacterium]|jgi:hypothetical protein|nr:hypothetical protein [Planctomycetaceae bacterium]
MVYCFLAVVLFCVSVLLYLAYRDQKQAENLYRTNSLRSCRIEVLEERDFLSVSPLGDSDDDDNDDYEPPYNPSSTYIEYNAYSNDAAQQTDDPDEEYSGDDYTYLFNSGNYYLEDNTGNSAAVPQNEDIPAQQTSVTLTTAVPAPVYSHNLLNDGTSQVTSAGNYYELTAERAGTETLNALNSATTLTIAATFNVDSVSGWHYIAAHDCPNNTGAEVFLRIRDGKLQFGYWDTYQNHLAETEVSANTWYSVAGTFDGTTWKLYVNGEVRDTETYTPPQNITNLNVRNNGIGSSWYVGRHGTPTDLRIFNGDITGVAVWDTALDAASIEKLKNFFAIETNVLSDEFDYFDAWSYADTPLTALDLPDLPAGYLETGRTDTEEFYYEVYTEGKTVTVEHIGITEKIVWTTTTLQYSVYYDTFVAAEQQAADNENISNTFDVVFTDGYRTWYQTSSTTTTFNFYERVNENEWTFISQTGTAVSSETYLTEFYTDSSNNYSIDAVNIRGGEESQTQSETILNEAVANWFYIAAAQTLTLSEIDTFRKEISGYSYNVFWDDTDDSFDFSDTDVPVMETAETQTWSTTLTGVSAAAVIGAANGTPVTLDETQLTAPLTTVQPVNAPPAPAQTVTLPKPVVNKNISYTATEASINRAKNIYDELILLQTNNADANVLLDKYQEYLIARQQASADLTSYIDSIWFKSYASSLSAKENALPIRIYEIEQIIGTPNNISGYLNSLANDAQAISGTLNSYNENLGTLETGMKATAATCIVVGGGGLSVVALAGLPVLAGAAGGASLGLGGYLGASAVNETDVSYTGMLVSAGAGAAAGAAAVAVETGLLAAMGVSSITCLGYGGTVLTGVAAGGAADTAAQTVEIVAGWRDTYDGEQIALSSLTGGIFGIASKATLQNIFHVQPACFTEGTQIVVGVTYNEEDCTVTYVTESIENIKVGDLVYSYDTLTGEVSQQEVTNTFVRESNHLNYLTIVDENGNEQVIETTDSHPFWVVSDNPELWRAAQEVVNENGTILYHENLGITEDGYWVEAKDLHEGDVFIGANGELSTLVEKERVEFPEGITVYNFTVDGNHDYFVIAQTAELGQTCVLVHNAGAKYLVDRPTKNTLNSSLPFSSEGEARNFARRILGKDPIQLPDNKMRSQNGKWQYRAKAEDIQNGHIHLEELNPATGEVIRNLHLRFTVGR